MYCIFEWIKRPKIYIEDGVCQALHAYTLVSYETRRVAAAGSGRVTVYLRPQMHVSQESIDAAISIAYQRNGLSPWYLQFAAVFLL